MKKGAFLMALAIATGMVSCAQGPKANMKNEVDTLSYMMGVSNTQGLQEYALGRMGIDSAHYADFVRGIEQGMKETDAKEKAYLMGMQIGQQVMIELDGPQHTTGQGLAYDRERTAVLEKYGMKVLRFSNAAVDRDFSKVCEAIHRTI